MFVGRALAKITTRLSRVTLPVTACKNLPDISQTTLSWPSFAQGNTRAHAIRSQLHGLMPPRSLCTKADDDPYSPSREQNQTIDEENQDTGSMLSMLGTYDNDDPKGSFTKDRTPLDRHAANQYLDLLYKLFDHFSKQGVSTDITTTTDGVITIKAEGIKKSLGPNPIDTCTTTYKKDKKNTCRVYVIFEGFRKGAAFKQVFKGTTSYLVPPETGMSSVLDLTNLKTQSGNRITKAQERIVMASVSAACCRNNDGRRQIKFIITNFTTELRLIDGEWRYTTLTPTTDDKPDALKI